MKTQTSTLSAIALSGIFPFLMATTGSVPPSLNNPESWIPWLLSIGGPLAGWGIFVVGKAVAAFFRERARLLRAAAQAKLADKDPKNDEQALRELAKAAGYDAAAEMLEQRTKR